MKRWCESWGCSQSSLVWCRSTHSFMILSASPGTPWRLAFPERDEEIHVHITFTIVPIHGMRKYTFTSPSLYCWFTGWGNKFTSPSLWCWFTIANCGCSSASLLCCSTVVNYTQVTLTIHNFFTCCISMHGHCHVWLWLAAPLHDWLMVQNVLAFWWMNMVTWYWLLRQTCLPLTMADSTFTDKNSQISMKKSKLRSTCVHRKWTHAIG